MRTVINGKGIDTSTGVLTYLQTNSNFYLANLYLIGDPSSTQAIWLTDWNTPLKWSAWGTFFPAVTSRGSVKSQVGLEVTTMDFEWTPSNKVFTQDIATTSPYQKTWLGVYDGVPFRAWTCYMPSPGDADTFGASELFGGRIGNITVERGVIKFSVTSFLDVINQMVPGPVIESTNTVAGYKGAHGPSGSVPAPKFTVVSATTNQIIGNGSTFALNDFLNGFLYMTSGTLSKLSSAIATNTATVGGHTTFTLTQPFPWPPAVGDTFYASAPYPINQPDGQYFGFPYVPSPEQAV